MWCIGKVTAEFIAQMEHILHLYSLAADPTCPLVCYDEKSYQLIGHTISPLEMKPGQVRKESETYERHGVIQILVAFLPLWGLRFVWISPTRRAWDFACFMNAFMEEFLPTYFPQAKTINLVCDNLNTHTKASFYKTFTPTQAFDLSQKIQFNYTPVNASWLNMAELEIHGLSTQCLDRRMDSQKLVTTEVQYIVKERNEKTIKVHWQFGLTGARTKFSRQYGKINYD